MHPLILGLLALVIVAIVPIAPVVWARFAAPSARLARRAVKLNARAWSDVEGLITASCHPTALVATAEAKLKEKLKSIEAEVAEVRDQRAEAQKEVDSAVESYANSDAPLAPDDPEFKAAKEARAAVGECDDRLSALNDLHVETLRMLGKDVPSAASDDRPAGNPRDPREEWNSSSIFENADMQAALRHMSGSKAKIGPIQLGEVASRDALVADVAGSANMRRGEFYGILPQLRRMLRVLDILPTGTMDGNSIPYTEESGSLDTAAEVAEGSAKGEAAWTPTDKEATAQTIAHWLKIRKQVLADFPALQSIIDNRLRYGVERRLEGQVLSGDGSGSNLRGILNTSGIGTVAYDASELAADQVLTGITQVLLADALADGIVMNPTDWAAVLKVKAEGDGHYYSGGPFSVTPQVMWGVPLLASKAIPQGMVLVGDFAIGAQLFIREGVNVLLSDSDQDDFIKNKVTLLAEMRAALAVWRPPAFSAVDIAA